MIELTLKSSQNGQVIIFVALFFVATQMTSERKFFFSKFEISTDESHQ